MSNDHTFPIKREEPPDTDGVVIWSNPDVPMPAEIASGEVEEFECPYNEQMQSHLPPKKQCDPCAFDFNSDGEDERIEALIGIIEKRDGTLRCEDCNEPIYGLYADGDGNHND